MKNSILTKRLAAASVHPHLCKHNSHIDITRVNRLHFLAPCLPSSDSGFILVEYANQFNTLKDRYSLYLDQLKNCGVDLSDYLL